MARHKLSKEQQICGIRKALANRKTPQQFRPSLQKRLKKLLALLAFVAFLPACSHAQFAGYNSPQSVQQTLGTATACTGGAQLIPVTNLGQTQHFFFATPTGATFFAVLIYGVDPSGNLVQISDTAIKASGGVAVQASGYYPIIEADVVCQPNTATFALTYTGTSATAPIQDGTFLQSHSQKGIFFQAAGNTTQTASFITPYANSGGILTFTYVASPVSGSTLAIQCQNIFGHALANFSFPLASTTSSQSFSVLPGACPQEVVAYTNGGAAGSINIEEVFLTPGEVTQGAPCPTAVPITVAAAGTQQIVAPLAGAKVRVCGLYLSVTTAGTLTINEGTGATCGTGTTNVSGVMTLAVGSAPIISGGGPTMQTNVFGDGLCAVSGTAVVAGWAQIEQH